MAHIGIYSALGAPNDRIEASTRSRSSLIVSIAAQTSNFVFRVAHFCLVPGVLRDPEQVDKADDNF
jgi:hypothetical protein